MKTYRHKKSVSGEMYYRLLFEHSADAILLAAPDGSIYYANPAACRMLHRTEAEICFLGRNGVIDPTDPRLPAALEERERTGRFKGELTCLRSDGQKFPCELSSVVFTDQDGQLRTSVIIHDLTEHNKLEEELRESQRFTISTINALTAHIAVLDEKGIIIAVNYSWRNFAEDNPPVFVNVNEGANYLSVCDMAQGEDSEIAAMFAAGIRSVISGKREMFSLDYPCHSPDKKRWFTGMVARFSGPGSIYVVVAHEDITERKLTEIKLQESEEKYRNIFNDAILGIYQTTPEGRIQNANPALARMYGYNTPEELIDHVTATQMYVNSEDREIFKGILSKEGKVEKFETRLRKKNGETIWVSINAHIVKDGQGNITHYEGTIEDITERKRAEEALRESEDNFRRSLDDSLLGVRIVTIEGETIYANRAILDIYGYDSVEELRTTPVKNRYTPQSYAKFQIRMKKRRQGKYDPSEYGINIVKKNGEVRYLLVFRKEILWNGERQFQTIYQDITNKKQAEEALRENEERLRTIIEASLDAIIAVNAEGQLVLFNGAAQELFQYSEEEALNQPANILLREEIGKIHQERLKRFLNKGVGQCGHIGRRTEKLFRRKDGSLFEAEVSMSGGRLDGLRLVVLAIHDITSRKQTEKALQESEIKYRNIFNDAILGIYQTTTDERFLSANPALARMCGYNTPEELIDHVTATQMYVNSEDRKTFKGILSREGVVEKFETQLHKKNGETIWVSINAHIVKDGQGNITHYEGTIEDITERKRAEETLLLIRNAVESASDAIGMSDPQGHHFYQNKSFTNLFEYTAEELEAAGGGQVAFSSSDTAREVFDAIMNGRSWSGETEMTSKSGRRFPVFLRADAIKDDVGKIISALGTFTDITERKRMEEALRESEERHRILTEKTIAGIYLIQNWLLKYVNPKFCEMHGYARDELIDKLGPLDLVVEEEREFLKDKIQQRLSGEHESEQFSIRIRRKDGEIRFLEVFSSYAQYAGKPAVLGTCIDVTEARRANETIKRSQKELRSLTAYLQNVREEEGMRIAREIHDELGQSLTGIKIDISWLKKKLADIVKPTDPIQAKIDSLLTLTESTIATTRELSLSLRPGILDDLGLVTAINWQLKRFQEKTGIICMFQSDIAEATIPADYSTVLFRISQECLANISRYADATKVKITFTGEGESLVLEIEDNGKGITTEQIRNPLSLGILGMRERIMGLNGRFSIKGTPKKGTKVRVELPIR